MTDSGLLKFLTEQNQFFQDTIKSLNENINRQSETIEKLSSEIVDLKEQLDRNSHNSSKPPAGDGYGRPNLKSLRTKSGKKPGGQKGHKASNLPAPKKQTEL